MIPVTAITSVSIATMRLEFWDSARCPHHRLIGLFIGLFSFLRLCGLLNLCNQVSQMVERVLVQLGFGEDHFFTASVEATLKRGGNYSKLRRNLTISTVAK